MTARAKQRSLAICQTLPDTGGFRPSGLAVRCTAATPTSPQLGSTEDVHTTPAGHFHSEIKEKEKKKKSMKQKINLLAILVRATISCAHLVASPTHVMMAVSNCKNDVSPSISLWVMPLMGGWRYCVASGFGMSRRRFSW